MASNVNGDGAIPFCGHCTYQLEDYTIPCRYCDWLESQETGRVTGQTFFGKWFGLFSDEWLGLNAENQIAHCAACVEREQCFETQFYQWISPQSRPQPRRIGRYPQQSFQPTSSEGATQGSGIDTEEKDGPTSSSLVDDSASTVAQPSLSSTNATLRQPAAEAAVVVARQNINLASSAPPQSRQTVVSRRSNRHRKRRRGLH